MDVIRIYEYALQREYEGKKFFEESADRLSNASAVGAFKSLALEEEKHIYFIQKQLEKIHQGEPADMATGKELETAGFFSQRADQEMINQCIAEAMVADLPVFRMAYLIERDFAEFYEMAATKVDGEARQVLELLASWERKHEVLFKNMHDQAFEKYSEMPWGG